MSKLVWLTKALFRPFRATPPILAPKRLAAWDEELGERETGEYRGGFERGLKCRLQRQNLASHFLRRGGLGLVDNVLEKGLGLGLPLRRFFHRVLCVGEIGLNIGDRLLPRLRRQVA